MSLTCTNTNSKWINDLNIKPESLKQLLEVVGTTLEHIGTGNNFLNRIPMVQQIKMNKLDCIKLKTFSTAKETVTRLK
jgi:hypothetical protein